MANCNTTYLKNEIDLSVLRLPKVNTEEICFVQVLKEKAVKLKQSEIFSARKEVPA
jgi:hypothetical protein